MGEKKKRYKRPRNWQAVDAHFRSNAGYMKNKKKEASKKACRDKGAKDVV